MSIPRLAHTSTVLADGKVLVVAGATTGTQRVASTAIFDAATNTWAAGKPLSAARYSHTATRLPNGNVLVVGGEPACLPLPPDPEDPSPPPPIVPALVAELYDVSTGNWSNAGELNELRHSHVAIGLPDGRVMVAGGQDCLGNLLRSVEIYGTTAKPNGWVLAKPLRSARALPAAAVLKDGRVLIAGGQGVAYTTTPVDEAAVSAELYEPAHPIESEEWRPTGGAMKYWDRSGASAVVLENGRVLVVGVSGAGQLPDNVLPLMYGAELYEPSTDSWAYTGTSLAVARNAPGVSVMPNGDVLVIGGRGPNPPFFTRPTPPPDFPTQIELYSSKSNSWSAVGELVEGVQNASFATFPNGKVLITGGITAADLDVVNKTQITSKLLPGAPCRADTDCATSACSDGVCCDTACGSSPSDCQACSVLAGSASDGTCGPVQLAAAVICRAPVGVCDRAEVCSGASTQCPLDLAVAIGTKCGQAEGECALDAQCAGDVGATALCEPRFVKEGVQCRRALGPCDVAENCTGDRAACPVDSFAASTVVCRASADECDLAELCSGSSAPCPADEQQGSCAEGGAPGAAGAAGATGSAGATAPSAAGAGSAAGAAGALSESGTSPGPAGSGGDSGAPGQPADAGDPGTVTSQVEDDSCSCRVAGGRGESSVVNGVSLLTLALGCAGLRRKRRARLV